MSCTKVSSVWMATLVAASCFALAGCGGDSASHEHEDGDHSHEDDHDHADDHGEDGDDDHEHGEVLASGSLTIGGTALDVELRGSLDAGASTSVDVQVTSGPQPDAVRAWIGIESGVGSIKRKLEDEDGTLHVHLDVPDANAENALWIEVQDAGGARNKQSLPLSGAGG